MNFLVKPIKFPPLVKGKDDWKLIKLFDRPIASFEQFSCHVSSLTPNFTPHPINSHFEEEIIIPIYGELQIYTSDSQNFQSHYTHILQPGSFVYHSPQQFHTLRCVDHEPAYYLVIKWRRAYSQMLNHQGMVYFNAGRREREYIEVSNGFRISSVEALSNFTRDRLRAHVSELEPGGGYQIHRDDYDIAAVLLEGELEIYNLSFKAPVFYFFARNTLHGFTNPGKTTARYLVFEFLDEM